jgi:hypothetical protein
MRPGACTPEELETMLEDAFVVQDPRALTSLFEEQAVLVPGATAKEVRGEEIGRIAAAMWDREFTYLADPRRVLQARDTALVIAGRGVNVVRRGSDGRWRYLISLLDDNDTTERNRR